MGATEAKRKLKTAHGDESHRSLEEVRLYTLMRATEAKRKLKTVHADDSHRS